MSNYTEDAGGIDELRAELGTEFLRIAASDAHDMNSKIALRTSGSRRRKLAATFGAVLVLVPATYAVAGGFNDQDHTYTWDGHTATMDGNPIDCPLSSEALQEIGFDLCKVGEIQAPAPLSLSGSRTSAGPAASPESLREGATSLGDYQLGRESSGK